MLRGNLTSQVADTPAHLMSEAFHTQPEFQRQTMRTASNTAEVLDLRSELENERKRLRTA